jgi:hypothetical protein
MLIISVIYTFLSNIDFFCSERRPLCPQSKDWAKPLSHAQLAHQPSVAAQALSSSEAPPFAASMERHIRLFTQI